MTLHLFIANHCCTCLRVKDDVVRLAEKQKNVQIVISDIAKEQNPKVAIVPALFVDDELYAYGEFDLNKFQKLLNK